MGPLVEFTDEVAAALGYYVYRLVDPQSRSTFYVGKGKANRAFQHACGALAGEPGLKQDHIRKIHAVGLEPDIVIHRHGLDEHTAYEIEAALIDAYDELKNDVRGHGAERGAMNIFEVLELYGAPQAEISVPSILIKIERRWSNKMSPDELYEATRKWWVCSPQSKKTKPKFALAIARGLIREVFEIERWERGDMAVIDAEARKTAAEQGIGWSRSRWRYAFHGTLAPEFTRDPLLGKSVRDIAFGSGNPIAYVACDT